MSDIPFYWKLLILLSLMVFVAGLDYAFRRETKRIKEYLTILFFGLVMGFYGMFNDMVTASLSSDYFIYGKGVNNDQYYWPASIWIGASAGISGGIIIGAILVCLRSFLRRDHIGMGSLAAKAWVPVAGGVTCSTLFYLLFSRWDVLGMDDWAFCLPEASRQAAFLSVWWEHFGVYVGSTIGTLCLVAWIARTRRDDPAES